MKRLFVITLLLALVGGVGAAGAERLYVPLVGVTAPDGTPLPTRVWVANDGRTERQVEARLLDVASKSARRLTVAAGGGVLDGLSRPGVVGVAAIEASADDVSAWTTNALGEQLSEVPVFAERDLSRPDALPGFELANYDRLLIGAANVGDATASCEALLFAGDGSEVARIPFAVAPRSLAREDVAPWLGSRRATDAQIACDRPFFPVVAKTAAADASWIFPKRSGPNGACKVWLDLVRQEDGTLTGSTTAPNNVHLATKADPKWIVCLRTPVELRLSKAVFEVDVKVGPWSSKNRSGIHNLAYYFLERYRSGVVGNLNALGPNKDLVKSMQNVNMPRGSNTSAKAGYKMVRDETYHVLYTYDAARLTAKMEVLLGDTLAKSVQLEVRPGNQQLVLRPYGQGNLLHLALVAEFGNFNEPNPSHPEVPTYGWTYSNFKVKFTPKAQ